MLLRQVLESLEEHVETDRYICSAFDLAGRLSNMICTRAYDLGNSVPISEQVTLTSSVLYPYPCAEAGSYPSVCRGRARVGTEYHSGGQVLGVWE